MLFFPPVFTAIYFFFSLVLLVGSTCLVKCYLMVQY